MPLNEIMTSSPNPVCLTARPSTTKPAPVNCQGLRQNHHDVLETRGLVREVTGRGRFPVWAAKV